MSGQNNSENFLVSDSLKSVIDPDSLGVPSRKKGSKRLDTFHEIDEINLSHPAAADGLFFPLIAWSEESVTVIVSLSHLEKFVNPVDCEVTFSLFERLYRVESTSAVKRDGDWHVTLFLGA